MLTLSYSAFALVVGIAFLAGLVSPLFFAIYWVLRAEVKREI